MAFGTLATATMLLLGATTSLARDERPLPPVSLRYQPLLAKDGGFAAIQVELRFAGDSDGVTTVHLPNEWGGFTQYYRDISDIRADGGTIVASPDPAKIELRHAPVAAIRLSYRVSGGDRSEKLADGATVNEYRPIIQPAYFHLIGEAVVAQPEHIAGDAPASFAIEGLPPGAVFASDLQHGELTFDKLVESVAVGGDFRIIDAGHGARLAVRGHFDARDDNGWTDAFRRTAAAITSYWEADAGPYLVTILPFEPAGPDSMSIGGTGRADAFAFFATTNAQPDTIDRLLAHEMTHSWVPHRIGTIAQGERQTEDYWFSEGFTDFASWRALARAGVWTPERYFREFGAALAEYDASPLRAASNEEAAAAFWRDRDAQRLAYLRGMLFAHWLDRQAAPAASARAILLAMQTEAQRAGNDAVPAIALLRREAGKRGIAIDDGIARYIDRGEPIDLPANILPQCGTLRSFVRPKFHRGFDIDRTQAQKGVIAGVVEGGPAWAAGMRDDMKLIRRSGGELNNSLVEIAYDIDDKGQKRTLRYMPQARESERARTFDLADLSVPAARQACIAALSR